MYYIYRYFLDAVYDINIVLKVKNAIIGYAALRHLDVAAWAANGKNFQRPSRLILHIFIQDNLNIHILIFENIVRNS